MILLLLLCSLVASIQANDPVEDPKFPEVNVQYGAFGSRYPYGAGFAYPACQDKIILDSSNDSVTSCGGLSNCTVYCLDPENRYESTYNCSSEGATSGLLLVIFLSLGFGMCCGGGGVWCYYRKKYGQPYSGYIEINA